MKNQLILGAGVVCALLIPALQPTKQLEEVSEPVLPVILLDDTIEQAIATMEDNSISTGNEGTEVADGNEVTPPHTDATQAPAKTPTNLPPNNDTVVRTNTERGDANNSFNGMTRLQYEDSIKYLCPSQVPDNRFAASTGRSRLNSIGKYSAYISDGTVTHNTSTYPAYYPTELARIAELAWDSYKSFGYGQEGTFVEIDNKVVKFYFDWNTLTVSWGKVNRDKAPESVAEMADILASSVTNHLRSINSTYNSRCPNN